MLKAKKEFLLKVITPDKVLFSGDVSMVTLPGLQGEFSILPHHSAFMSVLKDGIIKIHKHMDKDITEISIEGGCAQINPSSNDVIVLLS